MDLLKEGFWLVYSIVLEKKGALLALQYLQFSFGKPGSPGSKS